MRIDSCQPSSRIVINIYHKIGVSRRSPSSIIFKLALALAAKNPSITAEIPNIAMLLKSRKVAA